ncbi:AAA family ATPase [Geodermatophilus sp. SYSU D01176]
MRARGTSQQVGALAGRLGRAGERTFVGRAEQRELLAGALAAGQPGFAVLFLHGPGGIGKTALLRRLCRDAEAAGAATVLVDARTVPATPAGFTAAVGAQLGVPPGGDPVPALLGGPRPVLAVDTFEQCAGLQTWLRRDFLPRLPADTVTVVAGREPPEDAWRFDPLWQDALRVVALRNLAPAEARALLAARGVPEATHERVLAFTGGHPLALCLVAETGAHQGRPETLLRPGTPDVVRVLLERFVDEAPSPRHRAALEVSAHVRVTTESLLRSVLGDDAGELFRWLRARSFVEEGTEGLYPHDLAREVLDTDLRWRDPDRYADLHRRIREYLLPRLSVPDTDRSRAWRDLMFLHRRNPDFAPFVSWETECSVYEDVLRPDDVDAVLAAAEEEEGPESRAVVRRWLDRDADAFRVYRRPGRAEAAGFSVWLRLSAPRSADLEADPVVARAWQHVTRSGGLRSGEHLGVLRTFIVPGAYHRPSPAMDLVQVRCSMEWTSPGGPAVSVLAIAEGAFWAPQMAYIDHARVGEVAFGRRVFTLFAHDWRVAPPAAWFRMMAEQELSGGAGTGLRRPVATERQVLSAPEFEAAVRDALRSWRRADDLARNPLCRSRLVTEAGAAADPARTLADLLVEATDTLAADPRDAKLHRAVATTYFRGVATQEAAAERLGLPFSSYRRHLAAGTARLTAWLWDRELHGTGRRMSTT